MSLLLTCSIASVNAFETGRLPEQSGELLGQSQPIKVIPSANIYVDDDNTQGPWDGTYEHPYKHIQDGINKAEDGYIVYVFKGIYSYCLQHPFVVWINKSINLKGEDRENTIIEGGANSNPVYICSSNVKILEFTIKNGNHGMTGQGIFGRNCENVQILNCNIVQNGEGVCMENCSNVLIKNCNVNYNDKGTGIRFYKYSNVEINRCEIKYNGLNQEVFVHDGIGFSQSYVNSYIKISYCDIIGNHGSGIVMDYGENIDIHYNNIINNEYGIDIFEKGANGEIHNNNISNNNGYGILFTGAYQPPSAYCDICIYNNYISQNGYFHNIYHCAGIQIQICCGVVIKNNIFSSNINYSLFIIASSVEIVENNFINSIDDFSASFASLLNESNTWNGNFWSRPRILPKIIPGLMYSGNRYIPWVEIDWHPAQKPYDIDVGLE